MGASASLSAPDKTYGRSHPSPRPEGIRRHSRETPESSVEGTPIPKSEFIRDVCSTNPRLLRLFDGELATNIVIHYWYDVPSASNRRRSVERVVFNDRQRASKHSQSPGSTSRSAAATRASALSTLRYGVSRLPEALRRKRLSCSSDRLIGAWSNAASMRTSVRA